MNLTPTQLDRAAGALLGLAAGDALGAPYEFTTPGPRSPAMRGGGSFGWEPGEWTDDTQMAICVAEEAATGHLDPVAVGERFRRWLLDSPKDVGIQTRAVLGRASNGAEMTAVASAYFRKHPTNAAGNGSLMRTAPVALAHLGDDESISAAATMVSGLTHGDPLAGEACALWCVAIDRAVRTGRLDGVEDGLSVVPVAQRSKWRSILEAAQSSPPASFQHNGFVVTALQAALSALSQTPVPAAMSCRHLQLALETAVGIGDDTDTVAAIAGGLLGARWGASAVPFAWRRLLHGWPGYGARDLVRLAILAARHGQPDATGWPTAESLLPYYRSHFSMSGQMLPLADDDGVLIGDVGALPKAVGEVDVVISLCRVGRCDVPERIEHHELWLIDSEDPQDNPNLAFLLKDVARGIKVCREEGKRVFVHCVMAEARTPAVAAAYLAERLGISGADALARVRRGLPRARRNPVFGDALDSIWPERP